MTMTSSRVLEMHALTYAAAGLAIAGALLLSLRLRISPWAWVCWVVSNVLWLVWSWQAGNWAVFAQQAAFLVTSLIGVYTHLVMPWIGQTSSKLKGTP